MSWLPTFWPQIKSFSKFRSIQEKIQKLLPDKDLKQLIWLRMAASVLFRSTQMTHNSGQQHSPTSTMSVTTQRTLTAPWLTLILLLLYVVKVITITQVMQSTWNLQMRTTGFCHTKTTTTKTCGVLRLVARQTGVPFNVLRLFVWWNAKCQPKLTRSLVRTPSTITSYSLIQQLQGGISFRLDLVVQNCTLTKTLTPHRWLSRSVLSLVIPR